MASDNAVAELTQTIKSIQEENSLFLVEITTSALTDEKPRYTLREICLALEKSESWSIVDPLCLFPLLLPVPTNDAADLIDLVAKHANSKECLIAIQEAIENFDHIHQKDTTDTTLTEQLVRLLSASKDCMIRLHFRKRTPAETFQPIFKHLRSAIDFVASEVTGPEGRKLLEQCSSLAYTIADIKSDKGGSPSPTIPEILSNFIISVLGALSSAICSPIAQSRFALYYPRLVLDPSISENAVKGTEIVHGFLGALKKTGFAPDSWDRLPQSLGKLILMAHEDTAVITNAVKDIESVMPLLSLSLQQNVAVDEALAVLLTLLCSSISILSQEIVDPLATLLTPLSASHPDSMRRHIAFKLLSVTLARSPPSLRLAHLTSLISDCPFAQMRVAAIGLVKEAFLSASATNSSSIFNSTPLIRAVGPILFRANPPDIFENPCSKSLEKFISSSESARLTECLSFYYVWLIRDTKNLTGIRDRDRIRSVENGLLKPMKNALIIWSEIPSLSQEPHVMVTLASLQISLERVESALISITP